MNNSAKRDIFFLKIDGWKMKCAMVKSRYIGDGRPPTFNRNPYNGYINPYYWVDEFIPYYMEIMGVDRPWHKCPFEVGDMLIFRGVSEQ